MEKKLCIGLLTHCRDKETPERFEVLKKSIDSLGRLKRDNIYIYVWDNNSSSNVREYLRSKKFFDKFYFSDKNLYDLVAVHKLAQISEEKRFEYVCHLEDDLFFYDHDFLSASFDFLENNEDCGYLRILKYEYDNKEIYDKYSYHPMLDLANCQRHYNQITKAKLDWQYAGKYGGYKFYKNNWHWYNFASICRSSVFRKIIPYHNHKPLQQLEGYMMQKYYDLNLKVGVLDGGVMTHLGEFNKQTSQRIRQSSQNKQFPTICYADVKNECEKKAINEKE